MKTGMRERIKNADSPEAIAALVRDMLAEGYRAPYVARCLRAVDKRLAELASKRGGSE